MKDAYREYKFLNLTNVADEVRKYWEDNDIFQKSVENTKTAQLMCFMRDLLQLTECRAYITSWQGR